ISPVNYKLVLLYRMKIYLIFHISLLESAAKEILTDNTVEVENNESEYKIERIFKHRSNNNMLEYLIK
ncbi:hypothetical protein M406DRAFT_270227, partial [Cryphonectria parasitica EP155]